MKGIVFCADLYTLADRRSNDIDLFVYEEDLKEFDLVMRSQGFIQSLMPNGQLVEATKSEKLIQRMNYHDLVPYIKILNNGEILEVDINIHFDSKDNLIDKEVFEYGTQLYTSKEYFVRGFNPLVNLIFLCSHFYREGTNSIWVDSNRDVTLYKVVDIVNFIKKHINEIDIEDFIKLANRLNLLKACYFTFYYIQEFYDIDFCKQLIKSLEFENYEFLYKVNNSNEGKVLKRTISFCDAAFNSFKNVKRG